jgi:FtsP/CotA-like multicopper oxidase with cupredoxin domain
MTFQNINCQKVLPITALLLFVSMAIAQKTVRYDLYIGDTTVNYTGKNVKALAINGQIPAPTLIFTEGDTALIYVHNTLDESSSIHWHGIILPNQYDGVPNLTTAPIKPGVTHLFKFPIVQNGTYWYHSHTKLQEQRGMYGAFIIHKRKEPPMPELVMVLSDWANEKPSQIHRSLHNATDWYAIKKGSTQNYGAALMEGHFKTKLTNEWKRMLPMDVSDVYYNRFLINGMQKQQKGQFKKGEKVRIRIINGSASSNFWLQYAGGKMAVVASDGMDVKPVEVDRMLIAVSETYDIIVTIPDNMAYELKATPEDRTKFASLFLGSGMEMTVAPMPKLKYFEGMKMMNGMMNMDGSMDDMGMNMSLQQMDMNTVMYPEVTGDKKPMKGMKMEGMKHAEMTPTLPEDFTTLNYAMLRATEKTTLPKAPTKILNFELTGNMNRYVWTIDNKSVSEADKILIKKGENVRIILYNGSMMRHPMHLHGHFFRVLNGQGDYAPLKNVIDIMPMETDTLEFAATESGDWFFHCHILYHMMSGMGRIFSYENSPPNPELPHPKKSLRRLYRDDREFHAMAHIGLESTGSDGEFMLANTRWILQTEWRLGLNDHHGYESESHIGRYIGRNQFFLPYVGWDYRYRAGQETETDIFGQTNTKDSRKVFCAGFRYTLPMFLIADFRVDHEGQFRMQLSREDIAITNRLRLGFMVNSDREYMVGGRYILTKYISLSSHYDSDMGLGAGVVITY